MRERLWTISNGLSILRLFLVVPMVFFLVSETPTSKYYAVGIIVVAILTDLADGFIARKLNQVTEFGKIIDPLADKILAAAALFSFASLHLVDAWMVWIVVGRDFLITGLRSYAEWKDQPIVTSKTAQAKTFGEFVVIYYILILSVAQDVPVIQRDFGAWIETMMHPKVLFGMMLLVTISTIGTGLMYLFDNRKFISTIYSTSPPASHE